MSDTATATEPQARRRTADTLRALGAFINEHETALDGYQLSIDDEGIGNLISYCRDRDELVAKARAIGGRFEKTENETYFHLERDLAPEFRLKLYTTRSQVCERVVTTETVTTEVPDPELLAEVPMVTVTETVERVEWICPPSLLDNDAQAPVAA